MRRGSIPALVFGLLAALVSPSPVAHAAGCTRVLGGSQTTNWYVNGKYESLVVAAEWERQTSGGQNIATWGVGGSGWSVPIGSACTPDGTAPTRVVLHVLPTGHDPTVTGISGHIDAALAGIAANLPTVTRVTLIPPVHGVGCDDVDLSRWQPAAVEAIQLNLGEGVDAGPAVVVPDCSYFKDSVGHLTGTGANWAAAQYAATLPDGSGSPDATPPEATITSPGHGAVVSRSIRVAVAATDDVGVVSVELRVDDVLVGTDATGPFEVRWNTRSGANGEHTLVATALDAAGNPGVSEAVVVTVSNGA